MKKYYLSILISQIALSCISLHAQTASRMLVSSLGKSYTNSQWQVDFSLGEVVIGNGGNTNFLATQGFHQTAITTVGVDSQNFSNIKLYPNPASSVVNIDVDNSDFNNVALQLMDASGRILSVNTVRNTQGFKLDISELTKGVYLLLLQAEKEMIKFKLVKH